MNQHNEQNFVEEVLADYRICCVSRAASELCRKEVLNGRAKFGIGGAGKEVAQVALAKAFEKGDFRAGYYRDQTIMFALGLLSPEQYFAQLYADSDNDPFSAGRQMVSHYATPFCDDNGHWLDLKASYNITSDISSTAGQVARAIGLALASKKYAEVNELNDHPLSCGGKSVTFLTIGDGSTSEGPFLELVNAAAVLKIPLAMSIWDDGYAISVDSKYQTTKESISKALEGFLKEDNTNGIHIYTAKGWDYPALCEMYLTAIPEIRNNHIPALFHIQEMTQPLGHSTSGSHTRYKSPERLQFETELDCISQMRKWILASDITSEEDLERIEKEALDQVKEGKKRAWNTYYGGVKSKKKEALQLVKEAYGANPHEALKKVYEDIKDSSVVTLAEISKKLHSVFFALGHDNSLQPWKNWLLQTKSSLHKEYHSHLYSHSEMSALKIDKVEVRYTDDAPILNGYEVLNKNFEALFHKYPELFAFGEDVGVLGDVNQGMAGLQEKFGEERIFDTGIREWTIVGQAIGMAMRGLRPIAEIQYLDYIPYALAPLVDDLTTLHYRTRGMQKSPCIIRTRGHRLEGIWHTGSPMGMLINALRGMYLCVPRNMVQAAGMYNTLLQSDEPAMVIECLNAYRKKERLPENLGEFTIPLGEVEILKSGKDICVITYGACVSICLEAADILENLGISVEIIDVQTLLPFDRSHTILNSIKKCNKVLYVDEDVPGGASAYMMQQTLEVQGGFDWLEIPPATLTACDHRTPYGDNGDYATKPNVDSIVLRVIEMIRMISPNKYSAFL